MKLHVKVLLLFLTVFLFKTVAHAQIHLPKVFGDNMVLQRELKIPVWGNSAPGAIVTAELGNAKATTEADREGKWMVHLPKFKAKEGKEVTGFAIVGSDKQFHWAKAVIEGNELVVYSDEVSESVAIRYAWADNPECNLINSEGLPAVPFRTDDRKGITQK